MSSGFTNPKNESKSASIGETIFERLQENKVFHSLQPGAHSQYLDEMKSKIPERDVQPDIEYLNQSEYRPVRGAQPNFLGELKQKVPEKAASVVSI
jgi:hypothetical protein